MKKSICVIISLLFITTFSFGQELYDQEHGAFSTYLLGFYNTESGNNTIFKVANPTPRGIVILFAFYNANGVIQFCIEDSISSNGMIKVDCRRTLPPRSKPEISSTGIVKIISLTGPEGKPLHGIVGLQQDYKRSWFRYYNLMAETLLPSIPTEVLVRDDFEELLRIFEDCRSLSP